MLYRNAASVNSHLGNSEYVVISMEFRSPMVGMIVTTPWGFESQLSELNCWASAGVHTGATSAMRIAPTFLGICVFMASGRGSGQYHTASRARATPNRTNWSRQGG